VNHLVIYLAHVQAVSLCYCNTVKVTAAWELVFSRQQKELAVGLVSPST